MTRGIRPIQQPARISKSTLRPLPILLNHVLRHIFFEAQGRIPSRAIIGAAFAATAAVACRVVRAWAIFGIGRNGILNEDLRYRVVGESCFFGRDGESGEQHEGCNEAVSYFSHGHSLAGRTNIPSSFVP